MKRNILYTFTIILLLAACVAEQENPLIVATCTDGIRNGNETDIDCGGRCQACEGKTTATAPCASVLANNVVTFNNTKITFASGPYSCEQNADYFELRFEQGSYSIMIELYGIPPTSNKIYKFAYDWTARENEAVLAVTTGGKTYIADEGYLYTTILNGEMIMEFCSIKMRDTYSGSTNTIISGKLRGC
jgi:hypothetical protein